MAEKIQRTNLDAGDVSGACWISDPQTGQPECHFISQTECTQRGGVFTGGLCPAFGSEEENQIKTDLINSKKLKAHKKDEERRQK